MKIHVVLVRSEYASNVGAAARAMANMGGDRLILIDPACELNSKAKQMAAGAQKSLEAAVIFSSWDEFYAHEGRGVRIAITRRAGKKRKVYALEETLKELTTSSSSTIAQAVTDLYLIFGPEADGLNSEDLAWTNFSCHLPAYGEFASLNLAQAVLLSLFMARQRFPPAVLPPQVKGEVVESVQPFYFPDELIKEWLTAMGFDIQARRASAYLTLRRILLANLPTQHEIQVLEAILQQNVRKLKGSVDFATKNMTDDFSNIAIEDI